MDFSEVPRWIKPAWSYIYSHITPGVKAGDSIKAGQLIGYANLSRSSVIDFDIALEAWVQNKAKPLDPQNASTLSQALQRGGDYLQLLHTGQLDSVFNYQSTPGDNILLSAPLAM